MQTATRPPRTPVTRRPRDPVRRINEVVLRLVLITICTGLSAVLVAALLLPAFAGAGRAVDYVDENVLNRASTDDIHFPRFPERSQIYAGNPDDKRNPPRLLATIYLGENRKFTRLANVSDITIQAVLASEDSRFYEHGGFDTEGTLRALLENVKAGRVVQGGSTITQQLIGLQFFQGPPTIQQKIEEMSMAMAVEREYTKDQILELYLNKVYFGNGVYGIGTAAEFYFGKSAKQLNLVESALLAGLIQRPEEWNPLVYPEEADYRRDTVINRMASLGMITEEERAAAVDMPLGLQSNPHTPKAQRDPYFVQFIKDQILDVKGHPEFDALGKTFDQRKESLFQGGLKIYTTLIPEWQSLALAAARTNLAGTGIDSSISTVEVKTGAIRALVSGTDFANDELEIAAGKGRQTGSAAKPFTLVAAFRQDIPQGKVYKSTSPLKIPGWRSPCGCVYNAEGSRGEYLDLWGATQYSTNVVFAQLAIDVGAENIVKAAHDMGITTDLDAVPAITLGSEEATPLDMSVAYATLGNEGVHCDPYAVQTIFGRDPETGHQGELVYKHRPKPSCQQVVEPGIANTVTAMLERATCCGTGGNAYLGGLRDQAGKTGTASENTNAWYVGYTRYLSTAVWVGHSEGQVPMTNDYYGGPVYGGTFPADIWKDYMVHIVTKYPDESFPPPLPRERGTIPDVVGLMDEEAMEVLAEANFTPTVEVKRGEEPEGTIIEQNPAGGSGAELGSLVTIFASDGKGPPRKRVPNVLGLTPEMAKDKLQAKGFLVNTEKVETSDPSQDGVVIDQSPPGGKKADEGSTVTIFVGKYEPEPPPTTDPPPTTTPPGNGGGGGDGGGGGGGDGGGGGGGGGHAAQAVVFGLAGASGLSALLRRLGRRQRRVV